MTNKTISLAVPEGMSDEEAEDLFKKACVRWVDDHKPEEEKLRDSLLDLTCRYLPCSSTGWNSVSSRVTKSVISDNYVFEINLVSQKDTTITVTVNARSQDSMRVLNSIVRSMRTITI